MVKEGMMKRPGDCAVKRTRQRVTCVDTPCMMDCDFSEEVGPTTKSLSSGDESKAQFGRSSLAVIIRLNDSYMMTGLRSTETFTSSAAKVGKLITYNRQIST